MSEIGYSSIYTNFKPTHLRRIEYLKKDSSIYLRKSPLVTLTKCKNAYARSFQALNEFLNTDL